MKWTGPNFLAPRACPVSLPALPCSCLSILHLNAALADTEALGFGDALWCPSFALISESWVHSSVLFMTYFPLGTRNALFFFAKSPGADVRQVTPWLPRMRNGDVKTVNWLSEYLMKQHGGSRNLFDCDGCVSQNQPPYVFRLWVEHWPWGLRWVHPISWFSVDLLRNTGWHILSPGVSCNT